MSNQINIKNLTPEQIEDLKQQLNAYDEQPESIMDKVKSWEDAFKLIKSGSCFVNADASIIQVEVFESSLIDKFKNTVSSEKHAKSILAACQLMVIAEALNEGSKDNLAIVCFYSGKLRVSYESIIGIVCPIKFKDIPTAKYAMTQFEDLWYDYFMIDKSE